MVTDHNLIFSDSSLNNEVINESVKHALIKDICRRMTPQPVKIRADMELTCFSRDGIYYIKIMSVCLFDFAQFLKVSECRMYVNEFPEVDDVVMVQVLLFLVSTEECSFMRPNL